MKLSVIIVNYNVKFFLYQCLTSLFSSISEFEKVYGKNSAEVFVVDNNSYDGSCDMIKKNFSQITLIKNTQNLGFSKANNLGISKSKGEYLLILNPDTLIPEDTLLKVVSFMDDKRDAGGVGVKMINGSGMFLPESKRSFPYPKVSFYKVFGLSKMFPRSEKFGKYHLTYLDKDKINEVDVLSGAFMCVRGEVVEKIGGLDESYFMYGEDIDYSKRIKNSEYKNYYFPETTILHYKGESTKKESLNYVLMFYNAMIIFISKHFSSSYKRLYFILIKLAVLFRATLSFAERILKGSFLPIIDFCLFYLGFYIITPIWETYKFPDDGHYPDEYLFFAVPVYILIWIFSIFLTKGYKRPVRFKNLFKGIIAGTLLILIIYSLLNEEYRFSRILLIFGSFWALSVSWLSRVVPGLIGLKIFSFQSKSVIKYLIICENKHEKNIEDILKVNEDSYKSIFLKDEDYKDLNKLRTIIRKKNINCLVFDLKFIGAKKIICLIKELSDMNINQKIYNFGNSSIISAGSIHTNKEIYVPGFNIKKPENKRKKRISDIIISVLFLVFYPIVLLIIDKKNGLIGNILKVLKGEFSWVGYIPCTKSDIKSLPVIKKGILHPEYYLNSRTEEIYSVNAKYASNYNLIDDLYIIYKSFSEIGHKKL